MYEFVAPRPHGRAIGATRLSVLLHEDSPSIPLDTRHKITDPRIEFIKISYVVKFFCNSVNYAHTWRDISYLALED